MTTTVPTKAGPAQPVRQDTSGVRLGGPARPVYGFANASAAAAAGYTCAGGPARPVYIVTAAQLASGQFYLEGEPMAYPIYTASDDIPTEGVDAQAVYPVNAWPTVTQIKYSDIALSIPNLLQGFLFDEQSGTTVIDFSGNSYNGVSSNCTLKSTGKTDGGYAYTLNGTTSVINNYSAGLAGAFDGNEFTVACWIKVANVGVWSDGVYRNLFHLQSSGGNFVLRTYAAVPNQVQMIWFVNPSNVAFTMTPGPSTAWIHIAISISKSNNRAYGYINGVRVISTTGLGTSWTGALGATTTQIGADSLTPTSVFSGSLDDGFIYKRELSTTEIIKLADYPSTRTGYFLAYGDSKTDGTADDTITWPTGLNGFPKYLAQTTTIWELPRIGVSGRTTTTAAAAIASDLAALVNTDIPTHVLFNLGANDCNSMPSQATFESNVGTIVDAIHTKYPNALLYYMRVWVRNHTTDCNNIATWLGNVAASRSTWMKPGPDERVFLENGDNGVTYTSDGLHPNHAGHVLTAAQWKITLGV